MDALAYLTAMYDKQLSGLRVAIDQLDDHLTHNLSLPLPLTDYTDAVDEKVRGMVAAAYAIHEYKRGGALRRA